ncbi:hypothetical protein D3C73_965420 [compost metagenome]
MHPITATLAPEFVRITRDTVLTAGVHSHGQHRHFDVGVFIQRPGFVQHISSQQIPVFKISGRVNRQAFTVLVKSHRLPDVVAVHQPALAMCAISHDLHDKATIFPTLNIYRCHKETNTLWYSTFGDFLRPGHQNIRLSLLRS